MSLVVIVVLILLCLCFKKLHKTRTEKQHSSVDSRGNQEGGQNSDDSDDDDEHCSESTPLLPGHCTCIINASLDIS